MFYNHYYWGMYPVWWFFWFILLFWIFVLPYDIPGQRRKRDTPLEILKKRLAAGQITKEQYEEYKKIIESESVKKEVP